jgi:hypothetical protein
MNVRTCSGFLVAALAVIDCGGTETSNPADPGQPTLAGFVGSGCKKEKATSQPVSWTRDIGATRQALDVSALAGETAGLKCVAWETAASGTVSVGLINFEGACGAEWTGTATLDAQGLMLGLVNPACKIALCGWCIYDWTFDVNLPKQTAPLPVTIRIDTCPGGTQPVETKTLTLPIDTTPKGIFCNYANINALTWQAGALSTCGGLGMPCIGYAGMCQGSANPPATMTCNAGLTCTTGAAATESICAKSCTAESDCGTSGAQACTGGVCRPKTAW